MSKKPFFDAALLIDCWEEDWLKSTGQLNARAGYGRMCDYLSYTDCELLLYSVNDGRKVHPLFQYTFPEIRRVEEMSDLKSILAPNSKILIGGQSFGMCVHYNPLGIMNLLSENFIVYSSPKIINTRFHDTYLYETRRKAFEKDDCLSWVKQTSNIYRADPGADFFRKRDQEKERVEEEQRVEEKTEDTSNDLI